MIHFFKTPISSRKSVNRTLTEQEKEFVRSEILPFCLFFPWILKQQHKTVSQNEPNAS